MLQAGEGVRRDGGRKNPRGGLGARRARSIISKGRERQKRQVGCDGRWTGCDGGEGAGRLPPALQPRAKCRPVRRAGDGFGAGRVLWTGT